MNATLNLRTAGEDRLAMTELAPATLSRARRWTGRGLSGLAVAFLLFDAVTKVLELPFVVKATTELGLPAAAILPIGVVLLACTVVYCIPRTAILGAILLTGYLGGAVATNVMTRQPLASNVLFPIYFAVFVWGGLALRDRRVWSVFKARPRHGAVSKTY